ncbi:MAG TPA: ABC transporter substrate-binding protein [Anaerolineales bacterium]|nr:ABC transporter substrate-binding protein [Anaerolineales bacterium]
MRTRLCGRYLLLLVLLSAMSACGSREPIRVGFVAGLTGQNAALGVDGRDGALLAVEKINSEGGLNGRPIELVVRDDKGTSDGAVTADNELITDEGVIAIIGHMTSGTMVSAWPEFKDSGMVFLSPTVATTQLSGMDDNFFRLIPANSAFSEKMADYASSELGLKKVAIFYDTDNAAFTDTFRMGFENNFLSGGGEILLDYPFSSSSEPDFRRVLNDLKEQDPDGICVIASAVDTALIVQQARLEELDVQFLTSNWALTEDLIENGGRAVDGIITVVAHDETNRSPEYLDFSDGFQSRYGRQPTFAAGYGYEAVLVLVNALNITNGEKDGLANALLQTNDLPGVNGNISFDAYGDVVRTLYLVAVRDGQFVTEEIVFVP